jgi:hypothetical protein
MLVGGGAYMVATGVNDDKKGLSGGGAAMLVAGVATMIATGIVLRKRNKQIHDQRLRGCYDPQGYGRDVWQPNTTGE